MLGDTRAIQLTLKGVRRKTLSVARQVPRGARRLKVQREGFGERPPIVVDSFPKSGTHLLAQIAAALPGSVDYGTFIAMMPSIRFRVRTDAAIMRRLRLIVPGEIVRSHLWYRQSVSEQLEMINALHLFTYRDLRDVVVSEAFYLSEMAPWHAMSSHFRACKTLDERVLLSITGVAGDERYPDIARRWADYSGWLSDPYAIALRFEDLVTEGFGDAVWRIGSCYHERKGSRLDAGARDNLVAGARGAVNPTRSHTYRRGVVGGWRDVFSGEHKAAMKEIAGELLLELGYETGMDW